MAEVAYMRARSCSVKNLFLSRLLFTFFAALRYLLNVMRLQEKNGLADCAGER